MTSTMVCTLTLKCEAPGCNETQSFTDDYDSGPWHDARRAGWYDDDITLGDLCPKCNAERLRKLEADE